MREVRAQLLPETELIEGKGQDGTEAAADQGQQRNSAEGFAEGTEPVPAGEVGSQGGDQHADDAVIDGGAVPVEEPEQDIGKKAGQHAGQVTADDRDEHRADRVQIQREAGQPDQPVQQQVQRDADQAQQKTGPDRMPLFTNGGRRHA